MLRTVGIPVAAFNDRCPDLNSGTRAFICQSAAYVKTTDPFSLKESH